MRSLSIFSFFQFTQKNDCTQASFTVFLGKMQNLLYDMAGGEEKFLQKSLLKPYKIIAKNQLPRHLFLKNVFAPYSLTTYYIVPT